jgi:hypothetical protein
MGGFGVIPGWKVKRELVRLGQQLKAIPEFFWEPFAIRAHNAAFEKGFPTFEGQVPKLPKVAIVLCFQPKGLAKSFLVTLAHLVENGYSPLVISNSKLSDVDKEKLKASAWRVVERPNFGYDFGGYRDGIFLLRKWNISPDRLVILNDSIWFPVWENDTTLQKAEESEFDVVGMVMREKEDLRFLESYFYSIRGIISNDDKFKEFWNNFKITSNKYKVIRRGEKGFGRFMIDLNVRFGALFDRNSFQDLISIADESDLRKSFSYFASARPQDVEEANLLLKKLQKDWIFAARELIVKISQKNQFYSAFPYLAAGRMGYPVLKKSAEPVNYHWRKAWLEAVQDGAIQEPLAVVLEEVRLKQGR